MRIAFAVSEVEDLVKTGGLADVGKSLPIALKELGHDVRIVMPLYKDISFAKLGFTEKLPEACPAQVVYYQGRTYHFNVKSFELHGITVYLVDHPEYFHRDGLYSDNYDAFADNGQRFAFFSQSVLYTLSGVGFIPDILHSNDWHTALTPYFLKHCANAELKQEFADTRSILTIHNAAFQGVFHRQDVPILIDDPAIEHFAHGEYLNFLQTGLACCDHITTVSPNYANELLTDLGSHGLSTLLQSRPQSVTGILNGCDYSQWDPRTDVLIEHHFNIDDLSGKKLCKRELQEYAQLPVDEHVPLLGMVCRLTEQKGFGYILPILERLLQHRLQLVIIGTGDPAVVDQLSQLAAAFHTKFSFINGFSNKYAHWVEAGADFFLMPSQFEPCGLNQMYSLAYGTLPIVRAVGGLKDTVTDLESMPTESTGFAFQPPQAEALLNCIRRALLCYHEAPQDFLKMQHRAMQTRFTWQEAAQQYQSLYTRVIDHG